MGLFGNKPDAETQQEYVHRATQACQVCMYLQQHDACPPKDGKEEIDLIDEENRKELVAQIARDIVYFNIKNIGPEDKSRVLTNLSEYYMNNTEEDLQIKSDSRLIMNVLNILDTITRKAYPVVPGS